MYTIAVGNAFNKITLHGTFSNALDAAEHAAEYFSADAWEIVEIHHVKRLPEFDQAR